MRRTEEMSGVPAGDSEAHTRALAGLLLCDAVFDVEHVGEAIQLLAKSWPQEYPEGAV